MKALRDNFNAIKAHVSPSVKIMGIVKAYGYGHGLVEITQALVSYGIDYIGVGFLEEGITLRQHGITAPILVLGGVLGSQVREFLENDLEITVSSLEIAERIEQQVEVKNSRKARVHLKIDTGMERIGVRWENALQFIERVCRLRHLDVVGMYSHFATADERDKTFARVQLERFSSIVEKTRALGIEIPMQHIANSGAILDMPESYFSMVRPGITLYGVYPSHETSESIPVRPVLTLKSKVVYLKEVPAATSISYGRRYTTKGKTRVVTIPLGYGDGYTRRLSNTGEVLIRGKRCPIVGTICMDQMMADVGLDHEVHVGDDVVLIGKDGAEEISAWEVAERAKTIPYEFFTGLTTRVPRIFIY